MKPNLPQAFKTKKGRIFHVSLNRTGLHSTARVYESGRGPDVVLFSEAAPCHLSALRVAGRFSERVEHSQLSELLFSLFRCFDMLALSFDKFYLGQLHTLQVKLDFCISGLCRVALCMLRIRLAPWLQAWGPEPWTLNSFAGGIKKQRWHHQLFCLICLTAWTWECEPYTLYPTLN